MWSHDEDRALGVIRNYAYIKAFKENSEVVETRDHWLQKIRLMPETGIVETNYKAIKARREEIEAKVGYEISNTQSGGWQDYQAKLISIRRDANRLRSTTQAMFRTANEMNRDAVEAGETGMKRAKIVRDASIISIGVIGAVATGGTTVVAAGVAGGGLKGMATYQDTGSSSKALISGGLFMIPLGVAKARVLAPGANLSKAVVANVSLAVDTASETVEGALVKDEKILEALQNALVSQGVAKGVGVYFNGLDGWLGRRLRSAIEIMDDHGGKMSNRAYPAIAELTKKSMTEVIKNEASTSREASMGISGAAASQRAGLPFAGNPNACPLPKMAQSTISSDPAARYIRQNVLARM